MSPRAQLIKTVLLSLQATHYFVGVAHFFTAWVTLLIFRMKAWL